MAYCADSVALFGDIWLRDDGQLNWKAGMLEFNFQLLEVGRQRALPGALLFGFIGTKASFTQRKEGGRVPVA